MPDFAFLNIQGHYNCTKHLLISGSEQSEHTIVFSVHLWQHVSPLFISSIIMWCKFQLMCMHTTLSPGP